MKFDCKEISISDEEFGCTLTFSENKDDSSDAANIEIADLMNSSDQYLMLQRTYPEDDFEEDYYYIELSDFDKSGELDLFAIDLYRTKFLMTFNNELIEINLKANDIEFENLKQIILQITNSKGEVNFHD